MTTKSTQKLVVPRKVPKDGITAVLVEDSRKRKHSAIPADSTKVSTMRPKRRTADKQVNLQMTPSREVKTSVVSRKIPPVTNMSGTNTVAAGLDAKCAPVSSRLKSRAATKHAILKMAPTTKAKISVASRTISAVAKMPDKSEIENDSDSDDMCIWTKPQARKQKPPVHGNISTKRSAVVATSPDRKCPPVPMRPKTGAIAKQVNLPMTHQTKAKSSAQSFSSSLKSPPSGLIPSVAKMPDKTGTDSVSDSDELGNYYQPQAKSRSILTQSSSLHCDAAPFILIVTRIVNSVCVNCLIKLKTSYKVSVTIAGDCDSIGTLEVMIAPWNVLCVFQFLY